MSDALTVLAGGTEFELAVAEINALHASVRKAVLLSYPSGRVMSADQLARFAHHVNITPTGCWEWTGSLSDSGYARLGGVGAHRLSHEHFVGPIGAGLQVDHLCHSRDRSCPGGVTCPHRRCVNPDHLEEVTPLENARRAAFGLGDVEVCRRGHELTAENTIVEEHSGRRQRRCRECRRERWRAVNRRRAQIAVATPSAAVPARAVPTAVRADDRRRSGLPASGVGVGVGRSARSVGPAGSGAPSSRRRQAGLVPATRGGAS